MIQTIITGSNPSSRCQIVCECLIYNFAEFLQGIDIVLMEQTSPVRRYIQKQHTVPADRFVIDIHQLLGRLDQGVLMLMIEPARSDGYIALPYHP